MWFIVIFYLIKTKCSATWDNLWGMNFDEAETVEMFPEESADSSCDSKYSLIGGGAEVKDSIV